MSRAAQRTPALLSPQGGLSVSLERGRASIVPTRFGGVGAWRVRRNSAVFLRGQDRDSEDAVVFAEIGEDGYFDYAGKGVLNFLFASILTKKGIQDEADPNFRCRGGGPASYCFSQSRMSFGSTSNFRPHSGKLRFSTFL